MFFILIEHLKPYSSKFDLYIVVVLHTPLVDRPYWPFMLFNAWFIHGNWKYGFPLHVHLAAVQMAYSTWSALAFKTYMPLVGKNPQLLPRSAVGLRVQLARLCQRGGRSTSEAAATRWSGRRRTHNGSSPSTLTYARRALESPFSPALNGALSAAAQARSSGHVRSRGGRGGSVNKYKQQMDSFTQQSVRIVEGRARASAPMSVMRNPIKWRAFRATYGLFHHVNDAMSSVIGGSANVWLNPSVWYYWRAVGVAQ